MLKTRFEAENPEYNLSLIGQCTGLAIETAKRGEFVDTGSVLYTIERLNMLLASNDEPKVEGETFGEFMNVAVPVIAVDNRIIFMGKYPRK